MNNITIIGNLTRNPEPQQTKTGITVCKMCIAVNRPQSNADGEKITDFFNVKAFSGCADNCIKYLSIGKKVGINGSIHIDHYDDKDGNVHTAVEIIANNVEFLSKSDKSEEEPTATDTPKSDTKTTKSDAKPSNKKSKTWYNS